ncbi:hypothetical protein [Mariniblastus fucicola]|uniref:Uncharacterized protein n=1 Tax=Mariniblastus fucicola TaxID=980251 RepID=A0A5B9PB58_9BACT|nr:hypothetical protein [Mariniblastus fucicola]QEG23524.1 hypothetical protein MFFC18_34240 [Mariniblastus fucicola]
MVFQFDSKDEKHYVVATGDRKAVEKGSISGEVVLHDRVSGRVTGFVLTARVANSLKLSPRKIVFKPNATEVKNKNFTATAVIRLPKEKPDQAVNVNDKENVNSPYKSVLESKATSTIIFTAMIGDKPVKVEARELGTDSRIFRVKISIRPEQIDDELPNVLDWSIIDSSAFHKLSSQIVVSGMTTPNN